MSKERWRGWTVGVQPGTRQAGVGLVAGAVSDDEGGALWPWLDG
jgi:hypothetical protein